MTRIPAQHCPDTDMEWYGVDGLGQIAVFCSAGVGNLPEFVCENEERADKLIAFFEVFEKRTDTKLHMSRAKAKSGGVERCARGFSDKGLFYFDADDNTIPGMCCLQCYYTKSSSPLEPLLLADLPPHIQDLLAPNVLDVRNFARKKTVHVRHAYA